MLRNLLALRDTKCLENTYETTTISNESSKSKYKYNLRKIQIAVFLISVGLLSDQEEDVKSITLKANLCFG